ncbi:HK97-gp10 family putative phage morphogenesis protein [Convivina praedatoris]|uniref:HK97-gp10 family putative phage morphogenesis protein n=1 Tax=Convivina praedatoris TaxID=2880963 RepID=UPI00200F590B|nr:HK97-gp10 family putative phage morphogenesis protein [Convivina sp. LMG 32447]CAH1856745.1 hypothetical protein R077815_01476 [Convivina sp. LMG 32447]CAH1857132.1 hypothetical protein R078138_01511 [Convivina sp. LMG 32447]
MSSGFRIEGADKFISVHTNKLTRVPAAARELVRSTTASTQAQAARLAPVKTGFLRRNIDISFVNTGLVSTGTVTGNAMNRNFNYGYAQENGTRFIQPKLFMYQAYQIHKEVFIRNMEAVLENA